MAETTKKYVSLEKLGFYDGKIKALINANDAANLTAAKAYADSLAVNYDAAGSSAAVDAKLTAEVARAEAKELALTNAIAATQKEVDDLEVVVAGMYTNDQIDKAISDAQKAATYDDTQVKADIKANADAIDAIEADYLKAADKTELEGKITAEETARKTADDGLSARIKAVEDDYLKAADKTELADAIAAEAARADAAEKANAAAIKAIADDYLKAADKTELEGKIKANADAIEAHQDAIDDTVTTLVGTDTGKSVRQIANEELAAQLIGDDAKESLDTLEEIAAWIQNHPDDAAAMNKAIEDLEALVGTLPEGVTATTIAGYVAEVVAAEKARAEGIENGLDGRISDLEDAIVTKVDETAYNEKVAALEAKDKAIDGEIADIKTALGTKASAQDLADAVAALEAADDVIEGRLDDIEAVLGTGEGSVADQIAKAKQEAITTAASDATTKADAAEQNAKDYADGLNTAMDARVQVVEGKAHEHANKALLDTYTQTEANLADAVAKKHAHANAEVLNGITAAKVAAWDAAEGNAKAYADQEVAKDRARLDAVEAWQANMVECAEEDIAKLFQTA